MQVPNLLNEIVGENYIFSGICADYEYASDDIDRNYHSEEDENSPDEFTGEPLSIHEIEIIGQMAGQHVITKA